MNYFKTILCLISISYFLISLSIPIFAQSSAFPSISDMYQLQNRPNKSAFKQKKPEKAVEEIEAFYLKSIFLKNIFSLKNNSILNDSEEKFMGMPEGEFVNEILIDQMAKQMAKQDVLGFKRLLLRKKPQQKSTKAKQGVSYIVKPKQPTQY
jgi:hypothetical protein